MTTTPQIQLWVDEQSIEVNSVWVHFQREPYPGGHKFRIQLSRHLLADWIDQKPEELDEQTVRDGLCELEGAISAARDGHTEDTATKYVLNTFTSAREIDGKIELIGVCSPFVSAKTGTN